MTPQPPSSPIHPRRHFGYTIWLTGLSGAGKSTLALALAKHLADASFDFHVLDGDQLRQELCCDLGFSKQDRDENVRRLAYLARLLNEHGIVSIVAAISPYREAREQARMLIPKFVEIHIDCPLEVLFSRDTKGFYQKAFSGAIPHFSGLSDPYEAPLSPDLYLNSGVQSEHECLLAVLNKLQALGWLPVNSIPADSRISINKLEKRDTLPL